MRHYCKHVLAVALGEELAMLHVPPMSSAASVKPAVSVRRCYGGVVSTDMAETEPASERGEAPAAALTNEARARILNEAIAKARAEGWHLRTRLGYRAEMGMRGRAEALYLEVDPSGAVQRLQLASEPTQRRWVLPWPLARRRRAWWATVAFIVWIILGVVITIILVLTAASAQQELVGWVEGCFWLLLGLSVYSAATLGRQRMG